MRPVMPSMDREFIVGRIDGITAGNAMQLVDRAMAAERNGVYGKLVSSPFGPESGEGTITNKGGSWKQWLANGQLMNVYPSWFYLHGLFGTLQTPHATAVTHILDPECLTLDVNDKSPQNCVTRLTLDDIIKRLYNEFEGPGTPSGVIPRPDNTLVYLGYLDGFSSVDSFDSLLNWRDSDSCNTLCDPADVACKAASTDTYREIDTRCVRVADGFIGYNKRSYPLGLMFGSPTGWTTELAVGTNQWLQNTSGGVSLREPQVRADTGFDDRYSLWFENSQQRPVASCYASGDDLLQPPQAPCISNERIVLNQQVPITERAVNLAAPQVITVRFKYRALDLNRNVPLQVRLLVHESVYGDTILSSNQIDYLKTHGRDPGCAAYPGRRYQLGRCRGDIHPRSRTAPAPGVSVRWTQDSHRESGCFRGPAGSR